jgi:hypothetical protein
MTKPFFDMVATIDSLIAGGPASCDYERDLAPFLSSDALSDYFYGQLAAGADPSWLELLAKAGQLNNIPAAEEDKEKRATRLPAWPQGEYLKSIAAKAPRSVADVVLRLPHTDNARVDVWILDIALAFENAEYSAQLVPRIVEGLQRPQLIVLALKVGSLISLLAKAGKSGASLQLTAAALAVDEDSRQHQEYAPETPPGNFLEPRAHLGLWEYEQIVTKNLPDVVDAVGEGALSLLCDLLDRALVLSDRRGVEQKPHDFSFIWRPAIEEHEQNINNGVKHLLVSAVRDAADQIAKADPSAVRVIVRMMEERGQSWLVFRRIALHVLTLFPDADFSLVRERLLDRALFGSVEVRHEYFMLEKAAFGRLGEKDQRVMLAWIDQGPADLDGIAERWAQAAGRQWAPEERDRYVRHWKRDRLVPLEMHLDAEWKHIYEQLCRERQPEHPEFTSYHTGGAWAPIGAESPEVLARMSTRELVTYLRDWVPSGDEFRGPSRQGLAGQLTTIVSESPVKYSDGAAALADITEPIYVRAILQGFQNALKLKHDFEWSSLLDFCGLVVKPGRNVAPDKPAEAEAELGWTRIEVIRLLTEGFSGPNKPIPPEQREKAWRVVEVCTRDPKPTQGEEEEYLANEEKNRGVKKQRGVSGSDPLSRAINSPRGTAIEAVVQYALWVRKNLEKPGAANVASSGFAAMPEVEVVMNFHLNTENDPSPSIRAVYGERAPWLQLLDDAWARRNTGRIFPRAAADLWHAAWDTYIAYCAPYDNVFAWLRDEYAFAVEQIGQHDHGWGDAQTPDYALAKHLMAFYWRGKLDLESRILVRFFMIADSALRGSALNFVGTSLRNTPDKIPDTTAARLKNLWMSRVEYAKRRGDRSGHEMKEFGWWFSSSKFDDDWSIGQLLEALRIAGQTFPDHLVVQRLAEMAEREPYRCVDALRMIVEGDKEGWAILGWKEQAEGILRAAMRSGDSRARSLAEDLINLLGSTRRLFEFGKLLREPVA